MKKQHPYRFSPVEVTEEYLRATTAEKNPRVDIPISADRVRQVLDLLEEFEEGSRNPTVDIPR